MVIYLLDVFQRPTGPRLVRRPLFAHIAEASTTSFLAIGVLVVMGEFDSPARSSRHGGEGMFVARLLSRRSIEASSGWEGIRLIKGMMQPDRASARSET